MSADQRESAPQAGRYAPSPSGPLHIGNLRTALVAWVAARSRRAPFVLRIEDLDRGRCRRAHERSQLADLAAIGLNWDGPLLRQSQRLGEHRAAFERLRAAGHVYPCWCTRADVREAASAPHLASQSHLYPGTCRGLSADGRRRRARETGRAPAWRLDGRAECVRFEDLLRGDCEGIVDDVVVWRAEDAPAYNLAVVVDDDAQAVGEVVRGDDLIDSTPAQIALARLLGVLRPTYLHVPLVLGAEGQRLAKRDGAVTLEQRLSAGESIAQVVAWMARTAGLAGPEEPTSLDALVAAFEPQRLTREPVVLPTPRPRTCDHRVMTASENAPKQIDRRIEELGDWRGEVLRKVRAIITAADPDIVEEWKWVKQTNPGVPVWSHNGGICTGEAYKSVVKLTFFKGASLEDPAGLFNSSLEGKVRRAIDIREDEEIDERALADLVREAVALNLSK